MSDGDESRVGDDEGPEELPQLRSGALESEVWVPVPEKTREHTAAVADRLEANINALPDDHPLAAPTRRLIKKWRTGYERLDD